MKTHDWNSRLEIPISAWICLLGLASLLLLPDSVSFATQNPEPSGESLAVEAGSSSEENSLYEDCKRDYVAGRMAEVRAKTKFFLETFPESQHRPEMIFMQAASELFIDVAVRKYELLIAESPESDWANKAYIELGRRSQLLSKYDKALAHYRHVDPLLRNDNIRYLAIRCLLLKGEHEAGMPLLRGMSGMRKDAMILASADSYFGKSEYDEAKTLYEWVIERSPDGNAAVSARLQLCRILEQTDAMDVAQQRYKIIVTEYPHTPEAQLVRFHLQNLPVYSVQLGAFSQRQNAASLVNQLKAMGYDAYLVASGGTLYKVRVGRFSSRNDAGKAASELNERAEFSAMIVKVSD